MSISQVSYQHPDAVALIAELQEEHVRRYGDEDATPVEPAEFAPPHGLFLVAYFKTAHLDDVPVGCGGWRVRGGGVVELKRLYVSPAARGRGVARALLASLERTAAAAGHREMVLVAGHHQLEALALYASAGYVAVPGFGYYADAPLAVHLGKVWEEPSCPSTP